MLFILLSLLLILSVVMGQKTMTGIPVSRTDYSYQLGAPASLVTVEFTIDLGCSDTADKWALLTEVVDAYSEEVHFKIRILPLPYHQQSYLLSKAASCIYYYMGDRSAIDYMNSIIENQEKFLNSNTADMTYNDVVKLIAQAAVNGTGLTEEQYYEGMDARTTAGNTIEAFTRYEWKYSVIHGMFGTPMYTINGLVMEGLETMVQWQEALNPLVKTQKQVEAPSHVIYL